MSIKKTTSTIESTTSGEHRLQKNSIPKSLNPIVSKENKIKSFYDFLYVTDNKSSIFFSLAWFYFQPSFTFAKAPTFLTHNISAIGGVLNNLRLKCFANLIVRHLLKFCSLMLHCRVPWWLCRKWGKEWSSPKWPWSRVWWKNELGTVQNNCLHLQISPIDLDGKGITLLFYQIEP